MRRATILAALALGAGLGGCNQDRTNEVAFDGVVFRASADMIEKDRERFTVRVRDAGRSIEGARQAGAYEGVQYCIANYGTSRIDWQVGPETSPGALVLQDGDLIFAGTCNP